MNEVAELREKILVMSELSNIRAELVSIADRIERIPETLLQIELMHRDVQVALVLLRKMTATTERTDETDLTGAKQAPTVLELGDSTSANAQRERDALAIAVLEDKLSSCAG